MNKLEMLTVLSEKIASCDKCPELACSRKQTVPGEGNPDADVFFIGEAPGENEDEQGRPFIGKAGQLLRNIITAVGLSPEQVFIANILKCRPPNNRTPKESEAVNCRPFLDLQLKIIKPKYIVCLGTVAAQNILGTNEAISHLRGRVHVYNGSKVICTFHPSYLLRNPSAKQDAWEDMKLLLSLINEETKNEST